MNFLPSSRHITGILIFGLIAIAVHSCSKKINNPSDTTAMGTTSQPYTYLALGDSYTIGESVNVQDRFPYQAVSLLHGMGVQVHIPDIIATTGWTTQNLIHALDVNPPQNNYTIVTLLIGVNNQYQGKSIPEYKAEFTTLLNRAIQYAANKKNRVFVLSIPDYSVTPFAANSDTARIAREINDFNQVNHTVAIQNGIAWIDITGISRQARSERSLLANDGLHPSGLQYKKWADLLAPLIRQALQ